MDGTSTTGPLSNEPPEGMTPRARAIWTQSRASDPAVSAFVEASAGSGKTKLLTDRMLRLMLRGTGRVEPGRVEPGRIQCLTFTKAAAAEMALRLQHRLGAWVTLDDAALDRELSALLVPPDAAVRDRARALFADVLDLPGGMRIGTIHSFCQSLLRRFPLEAEISPHFQIVEEVEAEAEMQAARDDVLARAAPGDVGRVAALVRADDFSDVVRAMQAQHARLREMMALPDAARERRVWRAVGIEPMSDADVVAAAVVWPEEAGLERALATIQESGSQSLRQRAAEMLGWLKPTAGERQANWADWWHAFFDDKGKPRGFGNFPNKTLHAAQPWIRAALEAEQARLAEVEGRRKAVRCAEASAALLRLVAPALDAYAAAKEQAGLLDYGDLIGRTERLLDDPGAAWVLYKLDGGIDHLLLDEVQDTAPEQWRIAHRLTEEFFAGLGTRDEQPRTFFAVGDPKQSIYSFQGADPEEFVRSRARMADRVAAMPGADEPAWRDVTLDVSFRSTAPVLGLVDAVFADPLAGQGVADGTVLQHIADRAGSAGRVELWPLAPVPEVAPAENWTIPEDNLGLTSAPQRLADAIAAAIAGMLARGERLESQDRPLRPGDVLILVRRRNPFTTALVRALKAAGVPVAGLDRLRLTEQVAIQDLLAACDAVLLPQDDLAVANVLTSPLGGLSDQSLMDLAMGRSRGLWDTLRARAGERPDWALAWRFLSSLAERADYVTPHALLAEALGVLGGRARLLARLGAEAAEPIDELLNAALAYVRLHPPGLQGFVHWIRRSGAEVKREAGGAGSVVRIMTAHGAKGLQAPLVILPDSTGLPPDRDSVAWVDDVPLWAPRSELRCPAWSAAAQAARALQMREYNRLLYVALTRAEDRLIVCGWDSRTMGLNEASWYAMARRGFLAMGAEEQPFAGPWAGMMLVAESPQTDAPPKPREAAVAALAPLPAWAGRPGDWSPAPLPQEPALPRPLAPSRPTGATFGPVPASASPLSGGRPGMARGTAVHELLQHLPGVPEAGRAAVGAGWLERAGVAPAEQAALLDQVLAVMDHPALAPLFGPEGRAEQPVAGLVGRHVISGVVDRMAVLPDRVLLADFKTGRAAPARAEDTPVRYVRQVAAYRAVLAALFPGRTITCTLVWTDGAVVSELPPELLDRHVPGREVA